MADSRAEVEHFGLPKDNRDTLVCSKNDGDKIKKIQKSTWRGTYWNLGQFEHQINNDINGL